MMQFFLFVITFFGFSFSAVYDIYPSTNNPAGTLRSYGALAPGDIVNFHAAAPGKCLKIIFFSNNSLHSIQLILKVAQQLMILEQLVPLLHGMAQTQIQSLSELFLVIELLLLARTQITILCGSLVLIGSFEVFLIDTILIVFSFLYSLGFELTAHPSAPGSIPIRLMANTNHVVVENLKIYDLYENAITANIPGGSKAKPELILMTILYFLLS